MPVRQTIMPAYHLGVHHVSGKVTGRELVEASMAMIDAPQWRPGFNTLWDCRTVQGLALDMDDLRKLKSIPHALAERFGKSKGAMVVHRDVDFSIGKLLTHTAATTERKVSVFRDMEEAVEWLGLSMSVLASNELKVFGYVQAGASFDESSIRAAAGGA